MRTNVSLWRAGRHLGNAPMVRTASVGPYEKHGIQRVDLWFMPILKFDPPVLFEIIGGTAIGGILDRCGLRMVVDDQVVDHDGLRYVHGQRENAPGRTNIKSVLLALPRFISDTLPDPQWLSLLPKIYKDFSNLPSGA